VTEPATLTSRPVHRVEDLFRELQDRNSRRTDRMFAWLMAAQWVFAVGYALWSTPYTWSAGQRFLHPHVLAAVVLGAVLTSLPVALVVVAPGRALTRHVIAVAQMLWSALLIHVTGGRLETHFHVLGSLAFIAFYRDWRVMPGAVLTLTADHFVRGLLWPESVYGVADAAWWRFLEHGAWTMFEVVFLVLACIAAERDRWRWAEGQVEIEQLSAKLDEQRTVLACQSDASQEGVLVVSASRVALSANRRFKEIFGEPPGDFQPDVEALRASAMRNVVDPKQFIDKVAEIYQQPDCEATDLLQFLDGRVIERYTAPVRSQTGGYIGRGWYFRDVTERVRADAEVRALNAELEQRGAALAAANRELEQRVRELKQTQDQLLLADRLSSLGRVAAGIGHEINNPLTYVLGNLEEIRRLDGLSSEVRELLGEAIEGSERVRRIVGGLKSISRATPEQREPVDLHATLDSTIRMTSNEIRHRGRLIRDFGPVPRIEGDPSRMAQVFLNLIVNATQALTGEREGGNFISIKTYTRASGDAVVEIEDSGEGIPPERIPRLFDPFFTTKAVGVGTGLGLSICHGIVSAHGGAIEVDSVWGAGSRFRVVLPPLRGAPVVPAPVIARRGHAAVERRSLLLVDDDSRLLRAVKRTLVRDYDVEACEGGRAALEVLATGRRFDVILCDLHMPDLTGMDFHRRLRDDFPGLERTVIFMSGGAFTPEATRFVRDCPNPSIEKPVDLVELDKLISQIYEAARSAAPAAATASDAMPALHAPPPD
jgi:signal transduction histidine kinase/CheY-like chemotaxis protein